VRGATIIVDSMSRLRQIACVTTEDFSKLAYVAEQADVSNVQYANALLKLGQKLHCSDHGVEGSAGELPAARHQRDRRGGCLRSTEAVFRDLVGAHSRLSDGATRSVLAVATLGRAGADLVPLINDGSEGLARTADDAACVGKVVSTEAALAANQFDDNMTGFCLALRINAQCR